MTDFHVIQIDSEQRAIILETLSFASAFLGARAQRVDPHGLMSRAAQLQERKAENIRWQLAQGPISDFSALPTSAQEHVLSLAKQLVEAKKPHMRDVVLIQLLSYIFAARDPDQLKEIELERAEASE